MLGLRVRAEKWIVFIGLFGRKGTQCLRLRARPHDRGADPPVGLGGRLLLLPMQRHHAEHVREMLVQRSRFVPISEPAGVSDHTVAQFMGHHIEPLRESDELLPIAVAIDHLLAIPEGIVHLP